MPDTSLGLPPPDDTPPLLPPNLTWISQTKATFRCCEAACSSDVGIAEILRA